MKTRKRLGFTIVELVIVIAVIAILAAILIPTFSGVIQKANESSDTQLIRNLNTAIAPEKAMQKNGLPTAYSAFAVANENGYGVEKIVKKSGYNIAYDVNKQQFILLDMAEDKYLFPIDAENNEVATIPDGDKVDYFVVTTQNGLADVKAAGYSIYWAGEAAPEDLGDLHVGFDAGECEAITDLKFVGNNSTKTIILRTNSYETNLVIEAPQNVIKHFDKAGTVNIIESATASYHEFGEVPFIEIAKGRIALEEGAEVVKLHFDANDSGTFDQIIVAADSSVTLPEFSRDEANIGENGTLVVELQKDTNNDDNTDSDYVWLFKSGVISQIVVVDEPAAKIVAEQQNDGSYKFFAQDSAGENIKEVFLGVTNESEATQKAAVEIANNYTGTNCTEQTIGGYANVKVPAMDVDYELSEADRHLVIEGGLKETDKGVAKLEVVTEAINKEEAKKAAWLVDGVPFTKLEDAFEHITKQDEVNIVLQKDITIIYSTEAYITIAKDHKLTVDLNGNNVTVIAKRGDTTAFFKNNGELNLIDSKDAAKDGTKGSIKFIATSPDIDWDVEAQPDDYPGYANNLISNNGILTIDGGKYTNETPYGSNGSSGASYVVDNYAATFTLKGGFLDDLTNDVIRLFCNSTSTVDKVVIEGGIVGAENNTSRVIWIQIPNGNVNPAELDISGGSINGKIATYSYASGTGGYSTENQANVIDVNISGGNVANITLYGAKLTITDGSLGKVNNYCSYGGGSVNISGGTFNDTLYLSCDDMLISGGLFKTTNYVYCTTADGNYYLYCITGGTFYEHTYFTKCVISGYFVRQEGASYVVLPESELNESEAYFKVGTKYYRNLTSAMNDCDGNSIILVADLVGNMNFADGGTYTLDLNGHTVTAKADQSNPDTVNIYNNTNVTIVDTSTDTKGKIIALGGSAIWTGSSETDTSCITINDDITLSGSSHAIDCSAGTGIVTINDVVIESGDINVPETQLVDNRE